MPRSKPLSGLHIKLIACASMFTDHACQVLTDVGAIPMGLISSVGRIAFPLFAYLLLEGFLHTRDRRKYALNLLAVACISEVFYNIAFSGKIFWFGSQNTCFTLLLGLLLMICLEKCGTAGKAILMLPVSAAFACAFYFANVDYDLAAFVIFVILYFGRYQAPWFLGLLISTVLTIALKTPGAYLSVIPLFFYNGKRGRVSTAGKVLFYAFYPAHMAVLAFASVFLMPA